MMSLYMLPPGIGGEPVIYHGYTLTTKLPFREVIHTIKVSVSYCITLCRIASQCVTPCHIASQCITHCRIASRCIALCYIVSQCIALSYVALLHHAYLYMCASVCTLTPSLCLSLSLCHTHARTHTHTHTHRSMPSQPPTSLSSYPLRTIAPRPSRPRWPRYSKQ